MKILVNNDEYRVLLFEIGDFQMNCYLIYDIASSKGLLIDPGYYDKAIMDYIEKEGLKDMNILNTHGHYDHIGGNAAFGYPVLIHELDRDYLNDPAKSLSFFAEDHAKKITPARLLKDGDKIEIGKMSLEVIHTPGHTPGGISVRFGDIIFTGDTLFFEGIGRTDLPGGNYDAIVRSIREKLFTLPETLKAFPGHGPETTIGHEKNNNTFL